MKRLILLVLLLPHLSYAATIANCQNPEGHAYFPYAGMSPQNMTGWDKDKVTGGITQLVQEEMVSLIFSSLTQASKLFLQKKMVQKLYFSQ